MILDSRDWGKVWDGFNQESAEGLEKSLTVMHSAEQVDSVATVELLSVVLERLGVTYSTYTVSSYEEIVQRCRSLFGATPRALRTLLLINCGATEFVRGHLEQAGLALPGLRIIVVDSHRPVCIAYNDPEDLDNMLVMSEDDPQKEELPLASPIDELVEQGQAREEELKAAAMQEAATEEEALAEDGSPGKRQRTHEDAGPHRPQVSRVAREQYRQFLERKKIVEDHYDLGSSYGKPSAMVMLELALAKNFLDNTTIWPAMIGLTEQLLYQQTSSEHYQMWYAELNSHLNLIQQPGDVYIDDENNNRRRPATSGRIVATHDLRLMLYRHWTLYDAMRYSSYIAPRMQTWRDGGLQRMKMVLSRMGLPLEQAQTLFSSMKPEYQKLAVEALEDGCKGTNLQYSDLLFDSFELQYGFTQVLSASDAVYVVAAVLAEHTQEGDAARAHGLSADESDGFWVSCSVIFGGLFSSSSGPSTLLKGLLQAKHVQQAVLNDGGLIITRKQIEGRIVQELNLLKVQPTNRDLFKHPLTLQRLAMFARDAADVARHGQRKRGCPVVVVGPADRDGYCYVVGIRNKLLPGKPQYNICGRLFAKAAEGVDGRLQLIRRGFDGAVFHLHRDDTHTFLLELKYLMREQQEAAEKADRDARAQQMQQPEQQKENAGAITGGSEPPPAGSGGSALMVGT